MNTLRTRILVSSVLILATLLATIPPGRASAAGIRRYARPGGPTSGNCDSWAKACELYYALNTVAQPNDQVWVQAGTYTPDPSGPGFSFNLQSDVAVYGGFAGGETKLSQRNFKTNVTVLSGDIGTVGDSSDNSYHVVLASSVTSTALLDGFTILNGNARVATTISDLGGGIYNQDGNPTLRNLVIMGNAAASSGGGMYNQNGAPVLSKVAFINNFAVGNGGGLQNYASSGLKLNNVTFTGNISRASGGGMNNNTVTGATLTKVSFIGNRAYEGGGLSNLLSSAVVLNTASFRSNSADDGGGGVLNGQSGTQLTKVVFSGNSANAASGKGGGLYNYSSGTATLTNTTFTGNSAYYGGGLSNELNSTLTVTNASFTRNTAVEGAGLNNFDGSTAAVSGATFNGNSATRGGGLRNYNSSETLTNVTINGNTASDTGGGIHNDFSVTTTLKNVTVSGNTAVNGGDGMINFNVANTTIDDSIFWGNGAQEMYIDPISSLVMNDSILKNGCGLIGGGSITCAPTVKTKNPLLMPLANNGGPTKTMALKVGSPAIDTGKNSTCAPKDQRGIHRPQGPKCDMGAYEYVP